MIFEEFTCEFGLINFTNEILINLLHLNENFSNLKSIFNKFSFNSFSFNYQSLLERTK
jgi:hypothetical protein